MSRRIPIVAMAALPLLLLLVSQQGLAARLQTAAILGRGDSSPSDALSQKLKPESTAPEGVEEEDQLPPALELMRVATVGDSVESYIQNFRAETDRLEEDELAGDFWMFDGLTIQEGYAAHLATLEESQSFLEANSSLGGNMIAAKKFVPPVWLPMVANEGRYVSAGQFGEVYVIDTKGGMVGKSTLALKMEKRPGDIQDSEIEYAKNLDHPYVIKAYDSAALGPEYKNRKVIAMECAPGGDLKEGHSLYQKQPRKIVKAVLEWFAAVKYLHSLGLVHSDLKPEQVMLDAQETSKLGDFGLMVANGEAGIAGSPVFMAPDLVKFSRRTFAADMWSMGVSLYQLTRGRLPRIFDGATSVESVMWILRDLRSNTNLHHRGTKLDDLIYGLLYVDPSKRLDATKALEKASHWALSEGGLSKAEVADILEANSDRKRAPFPASVWQQCLQLSLQGRCQDMTCFEIASKPTKVECANVRPGSGSNTRPGPVPNSNVAPHQPQGKRILSPVWAAPPPVARPPLKAAYAKMEFFVFLRVPPNQSPGLLIDAGGMVTNVNPSSPASHAEVQDANRREVYPHLRGIWPRDRIVEINGLKRQIHHDGRLMTGDQFYLLLTTLGRNLRAPMLGADFHLRLTRYITM